jgi:hypothetical protein
MSIDWSLIIGLVFGTIIGCLSSCYLWIVQRNHRRKNIASALKNDILKLDQRIRLVAHLHIIEQAHSLGGDNSPFILPFYEKTDLFYTVMTDIFDFDTPLGEKIFGFYKNVIDAEKYRQMLIKGEGFRFDNEMYACLPPIDILTWEIMPMLDTEINWNILIPHSFSKYFKRKKSVIIQN